MNTLLWAGLVANALAHLRIAVLQVQDGEDRVKAGKATAASVFCWQAGGKGILYLVARTLASPILTAYKVGKFLLFPRGIKSKFAKEQEVEATEVAAARERELFMAQVKECEELIGAWAPGEMLFAESRQPEQVALGWHAAADAFDAAADLVARTAGQPWTPAAPTKVRIKAEVQK